MPWVFWVFVVKCDEIRSLCFESFCLIYREAAETDLKGILGYEEEDLVSTDFIGDSRYVLQQLIVCLELLKLILTDCILFLHPTGQASSMPRPELLWTITLWSLLHGTTTSGGTGKHFPFAVSAVFCFNPWYVHVLVL